MRMLSGSKKGVASLYAVVFATILFGVITLSFVRIILSEARQSGDDELSQSAYDSALAGVEDAKRAVNKYYDCLNKGGTNCVEPFDADCSSFNSALGSHLKQVLGYQTEGEIKIQESSSAVGKGEETTTDQAYTCITMSREVEDYRSTLTNDTRVRVVPLGIDGADLSSVARVEFKWFSENNGTDIETLKLYKDKALRPQGSTSDIPVISLTLLYTNNEKFSISDFNNSTSQNYNTMILLPGETNIDKSTNTITWDEIQRAGNSNAMYKAGSNDETTRNEPFLISCSKGDFACNVDLQVDNQLPASGNALLIVSMPYGGVVSDFVVTMYNSSNEVIGFKGAQISVDSTGRANQLYRRVETRLDPVDSYFPYPQFAAELDGDSDSKLWKNFWITYNCWTESGTCPNNGTLSE